MCEPAHSIVQYPHDFDDSYLPFGDQMDKESRLKAAFKKVGAFTRKIGKWFHISKMGTGHDGATGFGYEVLRYLPDPTNYEGFWWEHTFKEDTPFGPVRSTQESTTAAREYYNKVCMGSIKIFRQFLEISLRKTDYLDLYIRKFIDGILKRKGRDQLLTKLKLILPGTCSQADVSHQLVRVSPESKKKVIKALMGYTRKRRLFLPEWADDTAFWGQE